VLSGNCNSTLDVLDLEAVNPANEFASEGGPRAKEVEACIWAIRFSRQLVPSKVSTRRSYSPLRALYTALRCCCTARSCKARSAETLKSFR
jgi:hypothetical protein